MGVTPREFTAACTKRTRQADEGSGGCPTMDARSLGRCCAATANKTSPPRDTSRCPVVTGDSEEGGSRARRRVGACLAPPAVQFHRGRYRRIWHHDAPGGPVPRVL